MEPTNYIIFDGSDTEGIELGKAADLGLISASFTVEVFINPDDVSQQYAIMASDGNSNAPTSNLHFLIRNQKPYMGFYAQDTAANQELLPQTWYHLAFVYDKELKQQIIYVNGEDAGSQPNRAPFIRNTKIMLGAWQSRSSVFAGKIGRLRIWNSALSQEKIKAIKDLDIYNAPELIAFWTFKDGIAYKNSNDNLVFVPPLLNEAEWERAKGEAKETTGINLKEFINRTRQSIMDAREETSNSGFHLGNVHLDFKVLPQQNGESFIFPTPEQMQMTGTNLSTLRVDFDSITPAAAAEPRKVLVPDVSNLTEIMARRKLDESGLLVEVKYETTEEVRRVNRVVSQIPRPKDVADLGATIVIFIGKEILS